MADPAAAALTQIRERNRHYIEEGPYRDVALLLAAVEAALRDHRPDDQQTPFCEGCGFTWPCPTYRDVSAALLDEEGNGDG